MSEAGPLKNGEMGEGMKFDLLWKTDAMKAQDKKLGKEAPIGIFAPAVVAAANVMGRKELNALRAKVIAQHTKVISSFVDTSDSQFGRLMLK